MKIAIISPSPVPFTIGGIETLSWGLCEAINRVPGYYCELIKLPSKERNFWDLLHNYYNFYELDVSHFDQVICMKYPAWMVQHGHRIIYMAHCLRGLYDTYETKGLSVEVRPGNAYVDSIMQYMRDNPTPSALDSFFEMLFSYEEKDVLPEEYLTFPGPLIRSIIHYLDMYALGQKEQNRYYSISRTVKERWEYFPPDTKVKVIYPPAAVQKMETSQYQYLFVVSRLDRPKRMDLLIRAMKYVTADIKLYIGGTGPMEQEWKQLAQEDDRIEFLGYIPEEEIGRWYANSLVIPYFPYDEDYGLITLEAMLNQKPVITTKDAGGPTEFVEDWRTGFVTAPVEREIAARIDYLAANPKKAKEMGELAYERVKGITWDSLVQELLRKEDRKAGKKQEKITVVNSFPVYPPMTGGQVRLYQLYKNMAEFYNVEFVTFTAAWKPALEERIGPNLWEFRVPKSTRHQMGEDALKQELQISVGDVAMFSYGKLTTEYAKRLQTSMTDSRVVILSHPYLYDIVQEQLGDKPFIYEAQDVEYLIKKQILPDTEKGRAMLTQVREAERLCCENSLLIMTCSEQDKETLCELYHIEPDKVIVVPNGVEAETIEFITIDKRNEQKRLLGLENKRIGLFMGSGHKPNYEACEQIFQMAERLPEVTFLIIGNQCVYFEEHREEYQIPINVGMLGMVTEEEKQRLFSVVDFALNPMQSGSGTNLKLFDYMAAGVPVITTEFGSRGVKEKDCFLITSIQEMPEAIKTFQLEQQTERVKLARKVVEQEFAWSYIGKTAMEEIHKRL